ncbi:hypothetical protein [Fodinicola feengrottensis]|uniref:hypothetical protein n=1 Tax=Fodinicola feengrottensis TaxID=435914 RepID=UPI0024419504|nr:hypothetical protein [Fodinicola feengrottensis]
MASNLPALVNGKLNPKASVAYSAFVMVAWNKLHHLYPSPRDVFQQPYADKVERLFNGRTSGPEMLSTLPATVDELYTEQGLDMLRHPTGRLAAALAEADSICKDWAPRVPVRLLRSASGDVEAAPANTTSCQASFQAHGVHVPVTELTPLSYGGSYHSGSNITGVADTARWVHTL